VAENEFGALNVAERLWLKESRIFRETFITAYTSAWTITGHRLAKMAPVHYSVNSGKDQRRKIGNKHPCSHYFFCLVKIQDIACSELSCSGHGTWHPNSRLSQKIREGWQPYANHAQLGPINSL